MAALGYFSGVSNIVQDMIAEVFEDEAFIDSFLIENARRLGASYRTFAGGLQQIWLDLQLLKWRMPEG